jgi:hypothetical protein
MRQRAEAVTTLTNEISPYRGLSKAGGVRENIGSANPDGAVLFYSFR